MVVNMQHCFDPTSRFISTWPCESPMGVAVGGKSVPQKTLALTCIHLSRELLYEATVLRVLLLLDTVVEMVIMILGMVVGW